MTQDGPMMASEPIGSDAIALLRLLANGADAAELRGVTAAPELLELAEQAAARLAEHRRRANAHRALADSARELAAATDPEAVLDAIVSRARSLLGSDVAYLTLYDPQRGDTFMRATAGTVAATFRSLRLELGAGLGGLVASSREPWWTSDYPHDTRFEHTPSIDKGVGDEGLIAICGTPLLVEDQFVGVLFVSNRGRHTFTPEEVSLLSSLAAVAAVTIVQARARLATEAALREVSAAHEAHRRYTREVELSAEAHDRFTLTVASGGGIEDIARAVVDVLGGWTVIVGADGHRLCSYGCAPAGGELSGPDPLAVHDVVRAAGTAARVVEAEGIFAVSARAGEEVLSTLICGGQEDTPMTRRSIERAGAVTAVVLLSQRDLARARQQALSSELSELLLGQLETTEAGLLLRREGLRPHAGLCVVALRGTELTASRLVGILDARKPATALVGEHLDGVIVLAEGNEPGRTAEEIVALLRRYDTVTAGAVGPVGVDGIPEAFAEARRTLDAMLALGRAGQGGSAQDLGFAGLVVGGTPDVAEYVQRMLGPLLVHDRQKGSALVETLDAYFAHGRSHRKVADAMHIHVNTVAQRLERVAQLLGSTWCEPEHSLELQLALRMRTLLPKRQRRVTRPAT